MLDQKFISSEDEVSYRYAWYRQSTNPQNIGKTVRTCGTRSGAQRVKKCDTWGLYKGNFGLIVSQWSPNRTAEDPFLFSFKFSSISSLKICNTNKYEFECSTHRAPQSRGTELPHTVVVIRQKLPQTIQNYRQSCCEVGPGNEIFCPFAQLRIPATYFTLKQLIKGWRPSGLLIF